MNLKRELGLFSTTLYGIGVILGAGVYALIAVGAGIAGDMLWLAFLASAVIAVFTGLSYAELSSMLPKEAAEYNYTKKAFGRERVSFLVGWALAVGTIIAASTVALGFGGYFHSLTSIDSTAAALCLIAVMTLLSYAGIRESANFNVFATMLEVLGLVVVIAAGLLSPPHPGVDLLRLPDTGFAGIMTAVSVMFFAYIGFENIANLSEEVKDSRKTMPKALVLSLVISSVLYMLVAVASIREVGWEALSQSDAPLTLVVSGLMGPYASILSYIALFATANTVLMFLIVPSRILYGMSKGGSLPKPFSAIGSRGTPFISVAIVGLAAAFMAYAADIKTVAQLTDFSVFIAYFAVNASVIALARSKFKRFFVSPRLIGIPVLAYLGSFASLAMFVFFPPEVWMMEVVILAVGLALFWLNSKNKG